GGRVMSVLTPYEVPRPGRGPAAWVDANPHKRRTVLRANTQPRRAVARRSFACCDTESVVAFFGGLRPFQAVVEATASYEWLVELIEPPADQGVLAHPSKVYQIAHTKKKTDRHHAHVLAEKLAEGKGPQAHPPPPRPPAP